MSYTPPPPQQKEEKTQVMERGSFVFSESFESLTCGAALVLIGRLRAAADAGQEALKELAQEVKSAAISRLGGNQGGGVEVAFGRAMGRSFYATADGSITAADIVLFFTLVSPGVNKRIGLGVIPQPSLGDFLDIRFVYGDTRLYINYMYRYVM